MRIKIITTVLLIAMISCKNNKADTAKEGETLMQLSRDWSKSASTDDIEKTLSYWSEDAIMMSPGQPTLSGKKEIRAMVESSMKAPGFHISWEPKNVRVSADGRMAYMVEENQFTVNDSTGTPVTTYGKGVTIWEKDTDGNWKNVFEIWNDDHERGKK
jgi:uncharacterized protein (TIGR02246 family)